MLHSFCIFGMMTFYRDHYTGRMDNKDVFKYFDHYIASELRLPEAIDRQLLCPFLYFGVTDTVDYSALRWSGRYEARELSSVYTANDHRAKLVPEKTHQYLNDISEVKANGFSATKDHSIPWDPVEKHCELPFGGIGF